MEKRRKRMLSFTLVVAFGIVIAVTKPVATRGLRSDIAITREDIGIPGITKAYSATLTNRGPLPVRVARCNFITDAMAPGTEVAYAVQRWNESSKQWNTVVQFGKSEFCKTYPLGIVTAALANGWLWPGASLSTGEEATAARSGFNVGDHARFVVFTGEAGDYSTSVATPDFVIDEHPQTSVNFRVKH